MDRALCAACLFVLPLLAGCGGGSSPATPPVVAAAELPAEQPPEIAIADDKEPETIAEIAEFERGLSRMQMSRGTHLLRSLSDVSQLEKLPFNLTQQAKLDGRQRAIHTEDGSIAVVIRNSGTWINHVSIAWDPERASRYQFIAIVGFFMPNIRAFEAERVFLGARVVIESIEGPAPFPQSRIVITEQKPEGRVATIEPITD